MENVRRWYVGQDITIVKYSYNHKPSRAGKTSYAKKTAAQIAKGNERALFKNFRDFVVTDKYGVGDYFVTITFPTDVADDIIVRKKLYMAYMQRLKRFYHKRGLKFDYVYVWGRGDDDNMLHVHMLLHDLLEIHELISLAQGRDGTVLDVHVDVIGVGASMFNADTERDTMHRIAIYMWGHFYSLNAEDHKIIKRHFAASEDVNKIGVGEQVGDNINRPFATNVNDQKKK